MKSPLIALLVIVLLIPAIWFGIFPLWQDAADTREEIARLEEVVAREREANIRLLELAKRIEEKQEEVSNLEQTVSKEKDMATLIAVYEEAASQNGLVLEGVSPQETDEGAETLGPTGPLFDSFASQITLSGTYPAFRSFMVDVEHSFPLVDMGEIAFTLNQ